MTANISYINLATILEKYYRKEYEGYDIKVTLRPSDKKYRSMALFSDEWITYYEFSGIFIFNLMKFLLKNILV